MLMVALCTGIPPCNMMCVLFATTVPIAASSPKSPSSEAVEKVVELGKRRLVLWVEKEDEFVPRFNDTLEPSR